MRTLAPVLLGLILLLSGCAGLSARDGGSFARYDATATVLQPGDLLVAVERGKGIRHAIVRVRRTRLLDGGLRIQSQTLMTVDHAVRQVTASSDGRWLATAWDRGDEPSHVALWDLRQREGQPAWISPSGCSEAVFEPASQWLVVACERRGRQPAHLLQVEVDGFEMLALVGERDRTQPAVGVDGDLHWVEPFGRRTLVMRRPDDRLPYATHELLQPIRGLWPQEDGSVLAELGLPGFRREFVRLLASGVVRDEHPQSELHRTLPRDTPLVASAQGAWFAPLCDRGPCSLLQAGAEGDSSSPLNLGGHPTAINQVGWRTHRMTHPEDLATAPSSVLSSHPAANVAVLGVELGTPLETAYSVLDRAGRHPYWIEARTPRGRPRGIGLGWTTGGHCIEYLADERGMIVATDLKACAGHYLSPPLQPLLDRDSLADGPLSVARRYLGPGVSVTVGDGDDVPGERAPIRRTEVVYTAPERGYHFEAHTEVLSTNRSRLLGGWVWLRLQLPGRRQAAATRP